MPYTQDNRFIAIATPLDKDTLLLKSVSITEQLGRPFVIKADLVSEEPAVDFLQIIGKAVTIRLKMPENDGSPQKRFFSGYVSSFVQQPRSEGFYNYEATIVPWLWFLTRTADCRIFHKGMSNAPSSMSVPGIIKKVFKDHGFDDVTDALTGTYREMDHCVQYRETDYNFVSRLMEQEGIYYYFEHKEDGGVVKHKLKLSDSKSAHAEYPHFGTLTYRAGAAEEAGTAASKGSILSWSRIKSIQAGTFKLNDFDFKRPKTSLLGSNTKENQHANAGFEIYDNAANYVDEVAGEHGDGYSKVRMEELNAQHDVIVGHSDCPGIACGSKFTLEGHPREDENGDYIVVGVTYHCTAEAYKSGGTQSAGKVFVCDFTAIPADVPYRPARVTPRPRIQGPQTAIVVGKAQEEIWTDEFGRIKVQFHWDRYSTANENSPCWVRVAQAWAGKNWGGVFLPRIGMEVIVEFLDGNPDRPIVTGSMYNGESKPPYQLPDNATISTIKSNSSKGGQGFNEFRFEDKKESEQIFLHAQKDQDTRVKHDTKEWIGNDRHLIVKKKQLELIEGDQHTHVKLDQLTKVDGNVGRSVAKNETVKITGNDHIKIDGDCVIKIGGKLNETVEGDHHEKTTGDIRLTASANAHVKGSDISIEGSGTVHIKGMTVVVEGSTQVSLKVGGNFVDVGSSGVSITGTMVNINSGGAAGSGSGAQAASPSSPNDPDAVTDATEAANAEPGSSNVAMTKPEPPTPKTFSPSCLAMQEAASSGTPLVEEA